MFLRFFLKRSFGNFLSTGKFWRALSLFVSLRIFFFEVRRFSKRWELSRSSYRLFHMSTPFSLSVAFSSRSVGFFYEFFFERTGRHSVNSPINVRSQEALSAFASPRLAADPTAFFSDAKGVFSLFLSCPPAPAWGRAGRGSSLDCAFRMPPLRHPLSTDLSEARFCRWLPNGFG